MSDAIEALRRRYPGAVTFRFGDNPALCDELLSLVRAGRKLATFSALRDIQNGESMPYPGRRDIALDWDGAPALVIETLEVVPCRFCDVTEEMALAEGEDESLAGWHENHRAYFARNGGFAPEMELIWERFALVEDLKETAP